MLDTDSQDVKSAVPQFRADQFSTALGGSARPPQQASYLEELTGPAFVLISMGKIG
jgi:hypothetical protein